jgi:LysM repeat protein
MCHGFCPGDDWQAVRPPLLTYTVLPNDTCQTIAEAYAVSVDGLLAANNLADCGSVAAGQQLIIPTAGMNAPPPVCPVTSPSDTAFIPPAPYNANPPNDDRLAQFWYGTAALWTLLWDEGVWHGLPYDGNSYTQKITWFREGFDWLAEPDPPLTITGTRLDVPGDTLPVAGGNGSYAGDLGSFIMSGVGVPSAGCWQITGNYGEHSLSFVVWVIP